MTSLREDVGNTFFDYSNPMSWTSPLREGRCILTAAQQRTSESQCIRPFSRRKYTTRLFQASKSGRPPLRHVRPRAAPKSHISLPLLASHRTTWPSRVREFRKGRWPLDRFPLSKEMANIYSKFLWGFPIRTSTPSDFSERYDESVRLLSEAAPALRKLKSRRENVNLNSSGQAYAVDASLAGAFKKLNVADYRIYKLALSTCARQRHMYRRDLEIVDSETAEATHNTVSARF